MFMSNFHYYRAIFFFNPSRVEHNLEYTIQIQSINLISHLPSSGTHLIAYFLVSLTQSLTKPSFMNVP